MKTTRQFTSLPKVAKQLPEVDRKRKLLYKASQWHGTVIPSPQLVEHLKTGMTRRTNSFLTLLRRLEDYHQSRKTAFRATVFNWDAFIEIKLRGWWAAFRNYFKSTNR
jgi:hypothetical protein